MAMVLCDDSSGNISKFMYFIMSNDIAKSSLSWSKSHKPIVVYSFHLFVFCLISLNFFLFSCYQALENNSLHCNWKTYLVFKPFENYYSKFIYLHTIYWGQFKLCNFSVRAKNQKKEIFPQNQFPRANSFQLR